MYQLAVSVCILEALEKLARGNISQKALTLTRWYECASEDQTIDAQQSVLGTIELR